MTDELMALLAKATAGEWAYRPLPYDDWGLVRGPAMGASGNERWPIFRAQAGHYVTEEAEREHRKNNTDPYEHNAAAIVAAVNWCRTERPALIAEVERLGEAAQAVINQWDTPNWKLNEPTAKFINALRAALGASHDGK